MDTAIMFSPAESLGSHLLWSSSANRISVDVEARGEFLPKLGTTTTTTTTTTKTM
jgi:hypothetical protein